MARMVSTESNSPLTVRRTCSALVCTVPAAATALGLRQGGGDQRRVQPQGASLAVGHLDKDPFLLLADQVDLVDVGHPQHFIARRIGHLAQVGIVEAIARQRVQIAEGCPPNSSLKNGPCTPCGKL